MTGVKASERLLQAYVVLFLLYLFLPLAIMVAATFNTSRFPTVTPWLGTTTRWFEVLWNDHEASRSGLFDFDRVRDFSTSTYFLFLSCLYLIYFCGYIFLETIHARASCKSQPIRHRDYTCNFEQCIFLTS